MEIRFTEDYGNFNWADTSDFATKWYVTLYEGNNVVKVGDVACRLEWEEDGDCQGRYEMYDGVQYLTSEAWKYANKIWSTKDYKKQVLNFIKVYNENTEEIVTNFEETRKKNIEEEIKRLQRQLDSTVLEPDPIDVNDIVASEIKKLESWKEKSVNKLKELKEGGELYQKEVETITSYQTKIDELKSLSETQND